MAERNSEYERRPADDYETPDWVTLALLRSEPFNPPIWECAPGEGRMVRAIEGFGYAVRTVEGNSLLSLAPIDCRATITNPPYLLADRFIRHALALMRPRKGKVAMLLPMAFDCAKGRRDLFSDCQAFKKKIVLTTRIRWANLEQKAAGPSMNHAWFIWDWDHRGPATLGWLDGGV